MLYRNLIGGFAAIPLAVMGAVSAADKIPVEAFASLPSFSRASLSPSGDKIAFMTSVEGRRHIMVTDRATNKSVLVPPTGKTELGNFFWGNDETLVITFLLSRKRQGMSLRSTETKLFSFNIRSKEYIWLGKPKRDSSSLKTGSYGKMVAFGEHVLHLLPNDPNHILIQMSESHWRPPAVFKVNLKNGRRIKIKREKKGVGGWYADQEGNIRFGAGIIRQNNSLDSEKKYAFFFDKDGKETNLENTNWYEDHKLIDFSPDPNIIYVSGKTKHKTQAIFKLDVTKGEIVDEVFSHAIVDVGNTVRHPLTQNVVGVGYVVDTYKVKYFDKDLAKIQRSLKKALKSDIYITGRARNKNIYLVVATAPNNPGDYYLYDRDAGKLDFVAATRDGIYPEETPAPLIVAVPTRDGESIPAYVTLPFGTPKGVNLPTVILPHGGPHARDSADWDFWSQFYANRGYAVMQPNFRGSTGYGKSFLEAGENRWGGLMQDDVTDATHWMIEEGYADPDRICIAGASYGGYAAMFAPIKEPDLYKCAISINGVPDLPAMKRSDKNIVGFGEWIKKIGLKGEPDEKVSPYHRAAEINIPMLIMSSVDDDRVPYKMSQRMQNKMQKLGKNSRYIKIENGGHSMITEAARLKMLSETEKFLAEHIGE